MTTYNGERFIQEQLDSFVDQSRQPDELVICDDRSTDKTPEIIQRFAKSAPFPVRFSVNDQNLGIQGNFEKSISLCTGDVIFISDQDDIWYREKLCLFETTFAESPDTGMVVSNNDLVDEKLQTLGYTFYDRLGFTLEQQRRFNENCGFEILIKHCIIAGASLAFRSQFRSAILPFSDIWYYDAWIATIMTAVAPCHVISEPMYQYRQHPAQSIGGQQKSVWRKYVEAKRQETPEFFMSLAKQYVFLRQHLVELTAYPPEPHIIAMIDAKISFFHNRSKIHSLPNFLRLPWILRGLLRKQYAQYGQGWKTLIHDLLV